jgi:hypothetical protein
MKIKLFCILIILLFINHEASSQLDKTTSAQNIVYIEGGGAAGFGSLNYERILPVKEKLKVGLRVGLSTYNFTDYTTKFNPDVIIPIAINGLYGNNHKIALGVGQTISAIVQVNDALSKPIRKTNLHATYTIGYRYHKEEGGIIVGCAYTPLIEFYSSYRHWAGILIGYAF